MAENEKSPWAVPYENENETVVTVGRLLGVVSARNILWGVI